MTKSELRKKMMLEREEINQEERASRSRSIEKRIRDLQAYRHASTILIYVSFRNEVDTKPLIQKAIEEGKRVAVPVSIPEGKVLLPCQITSLDDLIPGTWGILEPPEEKQRRIDVSEIDLTIVPGLAFDRCFHRLGYGAGYYDRFLPSLRKDAVKIGVGYDFQLLKKLPVEAYDVPLDGIVTDRRSLLRSNIQ
ncbi:MAG: 5-formyltetrahydrofolate cyclo-ligase [Caldicoprobacterales bacterium]|jgi:5-formyltetrahydrofolate cyclo-ligase|nr:5-formyltetrahydrofolate cyclo-ligase [Clostridiales bacterium]